MDVIVRDLGEDQPLLLQGALPHQALAQLPMGGQLLAMLVGVAAEQVEHRRAVGRLRDVEHSVLRLDHPGEFRQDHFGHREQVLLALQHAGEPGQVGL